MASSAGGAPGVALLSGNLLERIVKLQAGRSGRARRRRRRSDNQRHLISWETTSRGSRRRERSPQEGAGQGRLRMTSRHRNPSRTPRLSQELGTQTGKEASFLQSQNQPSVVATSDDTVIRNASGGSSEPPGEASPLNAVRHLDGGDAHAFFLGRRSGGEARPVRGRGKGKGGSKTGVCSMSLPHNTHFSLKKSKLRNATVPDGLIARRSLGCAA